MVERPYKVYTWNTLNFKLCRKLTDKHESSINGIISDGYTLDDITKSIILYGKVINSTETFFNYKWDMLSFLKQSNGCRKFIDDKFENYLKEKSQDFIGDLEDFGGEND